MARAVQRAVAAIQRPAVEEYVQQHLDMLEAPTPAASSARSVARGEALTVRLHGERNPFDALDEHSEGARRVGKAVFEVPSSELLPDFERLIEGLGDRVLVVTELEVEREWRGHGLGPLIGGLAIEALSGGAVTSWAAPIRHVVTLFYSGSANETHHTASATSTGGLIFASFFTISRIPSLSFAYFCTISPKVLSLTKSLTHSLTGLPSAVAPPDAGLCLCG